MSGRELVAFDMSPVPSTPPTDTPIHLSRHRQQGGRLLDSQSFPGLYNFHLDWLFLLLQDSGAGSG